MGRRAGLSKLLIFGTPGAIPSATMFSIIITVQVFHDLNGYKHLPPAINGTAGGSDICGRCNTTDRLLPVAGMQTFRMKLPDRGSAY